MQIWKKLQISVKPLFKFRHEDAVTVVKNLHFQLGNTIVNFRKFYFLKSCFQRGTEIQV